MRDLIEPSLTVGLAPRRETRANLHRIARDTGER